MLSFLIATLLAAPLVSRPPAVNGLLKRPVNLSARYLAPGADQWVELGDRRIAGTTASTITYTDPNNCYLNDQPKVGEVCKFHGRAAIRYQVARGYNRLLRWLKDYQAGKEGPLTLAIRSSGQPAPDETEAFLNAAPNRIRQVQQAGGDPKMTYWELHFTYGSYLRKAE